MQGFKNSGKLKAVTFSFDDGITQDIRLINLFNKYGLKCTFNINSELLNKKGILIRNDVPVSHYKIWKEDVKELYKNHEVAAHTLTHETLTEIDDKEVVRQVEEDRKALSELVGYDVLGLAYPNGAFDERVINLIKNNTGIKYARGALANNDTALQENLYSIAPTIRCLDFENLMGMGKEFTKSKPQEKQILFVMGHTYEFDYDTVNWYKFEEFLKLISGHNDIFYGTNKEVLLENLQYEIY